MNNFLDVVLPPLLLLACVIALAGTAVVLTTGKLRLYAAKRRKIDGVRKVLSQARDVMATTIADPGLGQDLRDRALASYEALTKALTKEKDNT